MPKAIQMGPNTKVKEKQCEGTTTQQLLADLTDDFEEAITAQICLSNQLLDANLESVENSKEDILILKTESSTAKSASLPMELNSTATIATTTTTSKTTTTSTSEVKEEQNSAVEDEVAAVTAEINSQTTTTTKVDKTSSVENDEILAKPCETQEEDTAAATSLSGEIAETQPTASTSTTTKQDVLRNSIISLEELPPIRTDSTMTASEVEDNIEERLSQLDGNSTVHPSCDDTSEVVTAVMDALKATRARTPTTASQRVDQLPQQQQQQLHRTPPHTQQQLQQHQQQNTYTPQSSSSSVNTMGSSSTHINKDFLKDSSAGELEDQDIEEVLKALKGFDSSTAADTICDLNVLFNEVYTTFNYEEINSQHNSSACGSKAANPLKDIQAEIEKKQQTMQRKIDFLLRRLRKMQTRYMCKHTSEEISGLFEWSARIASKSAKLSHEDDVSDRQQLNYAEQKSHPVTSIQLSSMLRKIEMVANAQQLTTATSSTSAVSNLVRRKPSKKVTNMTATANSSHDLANAVNNERKANTITVVPTFDAKITEEIGHVTGLLQSEMHEIQNAIDSDATESSSGGESADEMVTYNNQLQQSLQIAKRAAWRYSRDRAAIASRWSWLLSQISDLEIKIRQHGELHQELLRTKGTAIQGMETITSNKTATTTPNSTPYNGLKTAQAQQSQGIKMDTFDEETSCCRTRGILATNFRKRKLFQTANIHTFSKKAARPSTIKCGCQWPLLPCALCTGRADPTSPRDLPDTMMLADRVALLDPGYHPVLSFPGDISNSIHFEALCRLPDWQQRVLRCPVKNFAKSLWKAERDAVHSTLHRLVGSKKNSESAKRKYIKKKDLIREQQKQANIGNGTGTLSMSSTPLVANKSINNIAVTTKTLPTRVNNNNSISHNNHNFHHQMSDYHQQNYAPYNPSQAHSSSISNTIRNSKNRKLSSSVAAAGANSTYHNHYPSNDNNYSNSELNYLHSDSWDSQVTRSRTSSPTHSGSKKNKSLDRRNRTSYDIDNIVIPYSVAAATRVELLPYKEIPTPKWRIIEDSIDVSPPISDGEPCTNNSKETLTSSVDCKNNNATTNNDGDGDCDTSKSLTDTKLSETIKPTEENNVASDANHAVETNSDSNATIVDAAADSSNAPNKCRLTTKRTYSEKENSVDTTDAFDTIKDSNTKSHIANDLKSSESSLNAKILKTSDDIKQLNDSAAVGADLRQHIEADNLNKDVEANAINNNCMEGADEDGVEDITDDAMVLRHERALIEERQRLKFPWSTRSRANRRIDSRVDWSSGANTPDPASPATNTPSVGGGDLDSIPSPAAPSTPLNPLDGIAEVVEPATVLNSGPVNNSIAPTTLSWQNCYNKRYERRRTTSAKNNKEQERRSTSPDPKEFVPPFEPRKFPIPNEIFENMIKIDNIINANSMISGSSNLDNNFKNEISAKRSSHKNNTINATISEREVDYVDSEFGFHEVDVYMQEHLTASDEEYQPYHVASFSNRKNPLGGGDSDVDTSEADPFSDDDPNDPEWKGETEERDKIRRKI